MGATPLDTLSEAIDALAGLDPDGLSDAELHRYVVGVAKQAVRVEAAHCRLIRRWDARQVWADNGSRAPGARLARETRLRPGRARTLVRRSRQLSAMPATAEAYAAGSISGDHVDLIASCNSGATAGLFAESEALLIDTCATPWFDNAARAVEYWKQRADPDGSDRRGARLRDGRHASISVGWRGEVVVNAVLDPLGGEALMTGLERLTDELMRHDLLDGAERTAPQRRADAIVEMARRAMAAPADGLRPRPLITVVVGREPFTRACQTAHGTVVAPGVLVPLLSEADIERIVFDAPDRVATVSHRRRFTGAMRRVIEVRDGHCAHPAGCDVPAHRCDVDHVVPWSHGGATSVDNGQLLCATHNRITKNHGPRPPLRRRNAGADPLPFQLSLVDPGGDDREGTAAIPTPRPPPPQAV